MKLCPVEAHRLDEIWPLAAPLLARACSRPGCTLSLPDLHDSIRDRAAALTLVLDGDRVTAAGVTQVRRHADGRLSAWVLTLGGSGTGSWRPVIEAVEAGARAIGCASLEFVGRRAWRRLFPDFDAKPDPVGFHFAKVLR